MGIFSKFFDTFNFKKAFENTFTPENFSMLRDLIKEQIIAQIKKNVPGQEKMDAVVNAAVEFINKHIHSNNSIVQWIIDNILIKNLRLVAQSIYDDLKDVIKGL